MVSVSIIAVLIGIFLINVNPAGNLSNSRNFQRQAQLNLILNAISQNIADNNGTFSCSNGVIPTATTTMAATTSISGAYHIAPCLVPIYIDSLPFDIGSASAKWVSTSSYRSAYSILRNATTGRITVLAPYSEGSTTITISR